MLLQNRPRPFQVLNFASVETCSREIGISLGNQTAIGREIVRNCWASPLLDLSSSHPKKKKKKKEKDLGAVLVIDLSDYEALEKAL
jgi:hypothetical protein